MTQRQNQFLGWALLSMLFLTYMHYFGTLPPKETTEDPKTIEEAISIPAIEQLRSQLHPPQESQGEEIVLENKRIRVVLSTQGGQVKEVILKGYKNYDGTPLVILNQANGMGLSLPTQEGILHTQDCIFTVETPRLPSKEKEAGEKSITLIYRLEGDQERYIRYTFSLQQDSYQLGYHVQTQGLSPSPQNEEAPMLIWYQELRRLEKDPYLSRRESTLYYYKADREKVTYLSANRTSPEEKKVNAPVGWVASNQKFFIAAIASPVPFKEATLISHPIVGEDKDLLKKVGMKLVLDPITLSEGTQFTLYFGPNQYSALQGVAHKFEENLYLGITPVRQINKYFILPIATYLENYFDHYLLILLILLLILSILQLPFTYQSRILEIKQKALEPMITAIKERYPNDLIQAQMQENRLKTKAGISPIGTFLLALLQVPIFFSIMNFVKYTLGFRQESFLWIEDLSTYDSLIQLPFRIPWIGNHLSIVALLASLIMAIPSFMKAHRKAPVEGKMMQYILPIILFLALNSYSAAFNIYRILSYLINLLPKALFRWIIKEEPIRQAFLERLAKGDATTSHPPRAQKRLMKKKQQKDI